jgi:hypothetical protein
VSKAKDERGADMTVGLSWIDKDPEKTLVDKVCDAAVHYQKQFHRPPTICYVNKSDYFNCDRTLVAVNGIRVDFLPHIRCNQLWLGESEREQTGALWYEAWWYQGESEPLVDLTL